jgi:hypothetical protein
MGIWDEPIKMTLIAQASTWWSHSGVFPKCFLDLLMPLQHCIEVHSTITRRSLENHSQQAIHLT